ncbi:hypothetical protein [Brachybacterium sp. FME24]|uniref:hypothetical protein n=1 Tax=Brachybacterium sp. FME24 TaxID=2742605 RepID=UPI001867B476|nr:hypothetical protein [Brachybacterium sp. FME24]
MTPTRTFTGYAEVITQFLTDYQLPEPRAVFIYTEGNAISFLFDGDSETAELISESLYWETNELDITVATVKYDGVHITAQVYES